MDPSPLSGPWMWHPYWSEDVNGSAGSFVHFRRRITLDALPASPLQLRITADTRYKLYVNLQLICYGPVKGDGDFWFYDQIDIQPYLKLGLNHIAVRVLRLFHATQFATSFPRRESPGLCFKLPEDFEVSCNIHASPWETAFDTSTQLPTDLEEDDFLHIYEKVDNSRRIPPRWVPVRQLSFPTSHGLSPPWQLSPRMIPSPRSEPAQPKAIHNIQSTLSRSDWERALVHAHSNNARSSIRLPAGTFHHVELEAAHHLTAFLRFHFQRPSESGSVLKITYSECYEDTPPQVPYLRSKQDRCDTTKCLFGPQDIYVFGGHKHRDEAAELKYDSLMQEREIFAPFHWRTFRFLRLEIQVSDTADLVLLGIEITSTNYPLEAKAQLQVQGEQDGKERESVYSQIWDTSVRTLKNCMHDCYEDCPFYERLQYSMDVMMVADHFKHFADSSFVRLFAPACDGVLEHFARRVDPTTGLVRILPSSSQFWEFVDWTDAWRPMGIPPAAARTGYCTYTSMLYSYTLKLAAVMLIGIQQPALAVEYRERADLVVQAIRKHCFDGRFFTDGLASTKDSSQDYSQHSQIWAVLCGATEGDEAENMLKQVLTGIGIHEGTQAESDLEPINFTPVLIVMSFYKLRALSLVGGSYDEHFHAFWVPWKSQLALNLSTWEEDSVSQRSDCHAWGCAALYEFTREVAGIRPGSPGWGTILFRPRLTLFSTADIKVPFRASEASADQSGHGSGIAHVKWHTDGNGDIRCSLVLQMDTGGGHRNYPNIRQYGFCGLATV